MNDFSSQLFAIALAATWCGFGLYGILRKIERSPQAREMLHHFRQAKLSTRAAVLAGLIAVVAIGGTKPGGTNDPPRGLRSPAVVVDVEPAFAPVEVRTNAVALRAESASAVEVVDWRKHGSSSGGIWFDFQEPVFRLGANSNTRAHIAANGTISFDSIRRPPVDTALPDCTSLPALAPLLAPLGMVPEANWTNAGVTSRFWLDTAPNRGHVFTWENALLDRLPGRRVSVQAELLPSGDFTYRYDFADSLDPPATNLVIGAQVGTNGVNALAILGTNMLAATVWRVDGVRVTNGVSIADLLCTNGVLRAPARFAIEWKNTSGIEPTVDTDGDGLSDRDEIFRYGTDPNRADTDGDALSDGAEHLTGSDPLDPDENGDGVPDGVDPVTWAADPLWASSGESADCTIVLTADLPSGTKASLSLGGLTIPLSHAGSWGLDLPAGQLVAVHLFSTGETPIPLALLPEGRSGSAPMRSGSGGVSEPVPRWKHDPDDIFGGRARNGDAWLAEPTLRIVFDDGTVPPANQCLHGGDADREYKLEILPDGIGVAVADAELTGFERVGSDRLRLSVPSTVPGANILGSAEITDPLDYGTLYDAITAHKCFDDDSWWCPWCRMYHTHEYGCEHEPGCPVLSGSGDCTCPPRVIRVSEGTNNYPVATCFVGTTHCCCPATGSATGAILVSHDANLVVSDASGPLSIGDRFDGPLFVYATAPSGSQPSEISYRLVGEDENGGTTNLETRVEQIWAVRLLHEPVTLDRDGDRCYNPCGIVKDETASFRFSLLPAAFPASNIVWSIDQPARAEFVGGANGLSVVVRGKSVGAVKLTVDIKRYAGPPPVFYAGVREHHVVQAKAYSVIDENGNPILDDVEIHSFMPEVNRIFTQVGIQFNLDPVVAHIADTNYLEIMKGDGTYPLAQQLANHAQGTGGVELYFVRRIEGAAGLANENGIIIGAASESQAIAHELGHACGLADILDFVEWKDPPQVTHSHLYEGEAAKWRLPLDWGTDSDEGYYGVQQQTNLIARLLMCGRLQPSRLNKDISYGDAHGIFPTSSNPTNYATCPIGFFTVPGHVPVHE